MGRRQRVRTDRGGLALAAPARASRTSRPGLVRHTDRGSRYTAAASQQSLVPRGLVCSLRRAGECRDDAMAERCFATRKAGLVAVRHWATRAAARTAIFAWIEAFDHRQRAHPARAYLPPFACAEVVVVSCPAA